MKISAASRQKRSSTAKHKAIRAVFVPLVESGLVDCARCGEAILPGTPWDLGHDDYQPTAYNGPEHAKCNRGAPHRNKTSRQW